MRYRCFVQYDGSDYFGLQRQKKHRTIQGEIERALTKVYSKDIKIVTSSRTDRGVHAIKQVFHYDVDTMIPSERLADIINRVLPEDIYVYHVSMVDSSFHARYSVQSKTYRYDIMLSDTKAVFSSKYALIYKNHLDVDTINEVAKIFVGKKNFEAVMASGSDKENAVRCVFDIHAELHGDIISIYFTADGFLYNMVRIITGSILNVSEKKRTINQLETALVFRNRSVFNRTVSPCGLYLLDISY